MPPPALKAHKLCEFPDGVAFKNLLAFNPINAYEVLLLFSRTCDATKGAKPFHRVPATDIYTVYRSQNGALSQVLCFERESLTLHYVQLLPSNRILCVKARSSNRSHTGIDKNAWIYSSNGTLEGHFLLGDGINDVQVTPNGTIWTSYFDEGVIGNLGWKNPIGHCGLRAWRPDGEALYQFESPIGAGHMADCYAMNAVSNDCTWLYYYCDFPLVRIKDTSELEFWKMPIRGSDHFAIYKNYALFSGGYDDHGAYYLFELLDNHRVRTLNMLSLADGREPEVVQCRGASLFFIEGSSIYRVSLKELVD